MSQLMPGRPVSKAIAIASLVDDFEHGLNARAIDVAEAYYVSKRTALRWINDIDLYLMPLERDHHCRWRKMRRLP